MRGIVKERVELEAYNPDSERDRKRKLELAQIRAVQPYKEVLRPQRKGK